MPSSDDIGEALQRTLRKEARRNELTIAYARAAGLLLLATMGWLGARFPALLGGERMEISLPITVGLSCLAAAVFAAQLRRGWFHPALPFVMPLVDGALFWVITWAARESFGAEQFAPLGALERLAICCAFLSAAGGLRLSRSSAVLSSLVAVAVYASFAFPVFPFGQAIASSILIGCVGPVAVWFTDVVRRAMEREVGELTLQRFLPRPVLEGAYGNPLGLLTEPRTCDATVLVSDLRDFTAQAEVLAPAQVLEFLNEIQGSFAQAVQDQGGTVDKFMGDGMLAVFGAPEPLADHAARAVRAALAMREAIARSSQPAARGTPVRMGVGVHSGAVVTGCLGKGSRLEFTVIGDTVNTASRLEGMTKLRGVDVLVSEATVKRIRAGELGVGFLPLGEAPVRGRAEPLRVYALGGSGPQ